MLDQGSGCPAAPCSSRGPHATLLSELPSPHLQNEENPCLPRAHPSMVFSQPHGSNTHLPARAPNKVGQRRSKEKGSGLVGELWVYGSPKSPGPMPGAGPQMEPQQEVRGRFPPRALGQSGEPGGWAASGRQPRVPRWALVVLSSLPWVLISWSGVFGPGHPS